jgi:FkbM family methyltransferase
MDVAAGSEKREITLYEITDTGLSTIGSKIAERHRKETGCEIIERKIQVHTLMGICYECHTAPTHFPKIDVEGAEKSVLEGLDLDYIRTWIIVIEATLPN